MKIIGDVTVSLPYTLDFCAKGPDVSPLNLDVDDISVTLYFPPSMSDGTVGKSFFPSGWAWWTGSTLRLTLSMPVNGEIDNLNNIRDLFLNVVNQVLRKFLNSYRISCKRPDIFPVLADPGLLTLELLSDDDRLIALPEPEQSFFYQKMPSEAPLSSSVNETTLASFLHDITASSEQSVIQQTLLDVEFLESVGEQVRADLFRTLIPADQSKIT